MGKDREPQNIEAINQQIRYQDRCIGWDYGIFGGGVLGAILLSSNINTEPGILRAVIVLVPALVAGVSFGTLLSRSERTKYVQGLRDGILQEAQRTATLANRTAS